MFVLFVLVVRRVTDCRRRTAKEVGCRYGSVAWVMRWIKKKSRVRALTFVFGSTAVASQGTTGSTVGGEGRSENEHVKEVREWAWSMVSLLLLSSRNGLEAADGALESTRPVSGEERTGREEEEDSGGALFIARLWNIERVCKVPTSVDDGPTVVNT